MTEETELQAEVARLRAVLMNIAENLDPKLNHPDPRWSMAIAHRIALATLAKPLS